MTDDSDQNTTKGRPDTAAAEPLKRARRVARTLLEFDIEGLSLPSDSEPETGDSPAVAKTIDTQNSGTASTDELRPAAASNKPKRPVAKTKLFSDVPKLFEGSEKGASKRRPSRQFVARTLLDHNLILEARSQYSAREKQRLEKEISERALEPQKIIEPIDAKRKVRECPFSWNDQSSKERFTHCSKCQSMVYNFEGMDQSQAEALIFQRENRKKFALYKRGDGKFMTSDCPLAQRQRHQLFGLVAVCFCVIALIGGFLVMMPPPPPPPPTFDVQPRVAPPNAVTKERRSKGATSPVVNDGKSVFHYEAGQPLPAIPKDDNASNGQTQKSFSDSEEKGEFWQFPNGQPADSPPQH